MNRLNCSRSAGLATPDLIRGLLAVEAPDQVRGSGWLRRFGYGARTFALALLMMAAALPAAAQNLMRGDGALLRGLDKLAGRAVDLEVPLGASVQFGRLSIEVADCRYPEGDAEARSEVLLQITDNRDTEPRFTGWMLAESPALSAMDHPRYDVWLLRCTSS